MIVPIVLFGSSVLAMAAAWTHPDLFLLALLCAVASAIVLLRAWRARETPSNWIVVDGSNVMYWDGGTPKLATVVTVLERLKTLGFVPGVLFDANAGYLLEGRHRNDAGLARDLGLPESRVMVMYKGVQADGYILKSAQDLRARVVTNDRFRDWQDEYPEVLVSGYLVQGGFREGKLWLDI
jgi:hypothetical protein